VIVYLDTSIVLRVLLRDGTVLSRWGTWERAYASELLGVEARRTFDRLRLAGVLDDKSLAVIARELERLERGIGRIALNRAVLRRAAQPMGTAVRALDGIHLASALLFRERRGLEVVFATHDAQQATAARVLGFSCIGTDGP
jgi:predicted nucleic acid-binding protein